MIKNLLKTLAGLSIGATPLTLITCTHVSSTLDLPLHEYFIDQQTQDSPARAHLIFPELDRAHLNRLPADSTAFYNLDLVAGGYGEKRRYYLEGEHSETYHAGLDVMRQQNSPIYSPVDGQIIAKFWLHQAHEFAHGIGGVVLLRTLISQLNIPDDYKQIMFLKHGNKIVSLPKMIFINSNHYQFDPYYQQVSASDYQAYLDTLEPAKRLEILEEQKWIYISFMHLSRDSIASAPDKFLDFEAHNHQIRVNQDMDFNRPLTVKRGDLIGQIGDRNENGGWEPHVHIEVNTFNSRLNHRRLVRYQSASNPSYGSIFAAKPAGTYLAANVERHNAQTWNNFAVEHGFIDPNNLFQIYDNATDIINVK